MLGLSGQVMNSFSNCLRLNVCNHYTPYDKLLNLELPNKSNLFADQTPTPTRLIGKCEEVGLFEDLQNVNPFEETFRRAVEEKSSGSGESAQEKAVPVIGPIGTGDDTLHTPHVFPLLERRDSRKLSKLIISRSSSRKDDTPVSVSQSVLASDARTTSKRKQQFVNPISKKQHVNILPKVTPSSHPVIIISCERDDRLSVIKTTSPLHPVKAKLKKYLARNGSQTELQQQAVQLTSSNTTTSTLSAPKKTKSAAAVSEASIPRSHVSEEATILKHERWKAAAKRYRTRVKQNQDCVHRKNVELQQENLQLKTELAQLKSALSLHKDCSVTRALVAGTNINAAGPSKLMFIPVDNGIHHRPQQQQSVEPQVVGNTVALNSNPVYIILGGINPLPEVGKKESN
ncbi:cyclic AMP-dependent transcription factor ATF-2-like [Ochlerotatus camptorhynchus]|uniref:cyclic AMP-dependent transcription factor ATF-2-like n=1 Tax=Ochlerotatus camptorhynchus TaxID=644619 RepID=UPI0031DDED84